jgi:V8-like Glu-specific endopeptidase
LPHPIEASTLRILNSNGDTVGTGFLVAPNLAVTCAHVVIDAVKTIDSMAGKTIKVQFTGQAKQLDTLVLPEYRRDVDQEDIAILQINEVSNGVTCSLRALRHE